MRITNKITSLFLSVFTLLGIFFAAPFSVSAAVTASGTFENISYKIEDNVLTISGNGATGGKIGDTKPWYDYRESITKIVVEEGITDIGKSFFSGLGKVTEVSLPDSLNSLGEYAFSNNSSLAKIVFPDNLSSIGSFAFLYCRNLKNINFPKKCNFGSWTFDDCGFTSLLIPSSFEGSISGYCFSNNSNLKRVTVGENVNLNGRGIFSGCGQLNLLSVSSDNPYVCTVDNVLYTKDMSELLFYAPGKKNTEFTVPDGVKIIGDYSFDDIEALTKVTLPEGVTTLEEGAFRGCTNLSTFSFPDSLENIESYALDNTAWLDNHADGMIYVGKIAFNLKGDSTKVVRIKMGTKKIAAGCFSNCTSLTRVFLNASLTEIGESAFYGCTLLNDVEIPDNVTEIGNKAFYDCDSLTNIKIGKGITKLNKFVFAMCDKLEELEIPDNITYIDEYAFHGDTAMKKLTVPASVKNIEYYAIGYYPVNNMYVSNSDLTVYGYKGSAAEKYCSKYSLYFIALDSGKIGDVNGDNSIDVLDAMEIQKYAVGKIKLTGEKLNLADVNNDNSVDILDAADIHKYSVGKITEFKKK